MQNAENNRPDAPPAAKSPPPRAARPLTLPPRPAGADEAAAKIEAETEAKMRRLDDVRAEIASVSADEMRAIIDALEGGDGGSSPGDSGAPGGAGDGAPRVEWLPEYAGMRLAVAICAARGAYIQRLEERRRDTRIPGEVKCRIVRLITLAWLRCNGAFFVDANDMRASTAYYYYRRAGRYYALASEEFVAWLVGSMGMEPTAREVVNCRQAVAMAAVTPTLSHAVEYRRYFAHVGDTVYISNGEAEVVAITRNAISRQINGAGGVFFPPDSCLPTWRRVEAVDPLSTVLYGRMATVAGERARTLIKLWLCCLPFCPQNKPLLVFVGGVGSGKTKSATGVFRVLGVEPRTCDFARDAKPDDFWTAVNRGGVLTVDNVDAKIPWLPQALAAASTGGSMESRKLYSNDELITRRANAWIVITTASPQFAQDAGCADRILKIELYRRDEPTSDSALDAEIAERRDGLMSYIVRAVQGALGVEEAPPAGLNRRHPDWAAWAWRVGVALGIREAAEESLYGAEDDKSMFSLVSDEAFGAPFVRWMDARDSDWEGDAAELLSALTTAQIISQDDARNLSPRGIGRRLGASWAFFRQLYGAEKRISAGRVIYRFTPRRGGLGGFNDQFSTFFTMSSQNIDKKGEIGNPNTPNPPTPQKNSFDDEFAPDPGAPYDPLI